MARLTGEDFEWRSKAYSKIKTIHAQGHKTSHLRSIETEVGANTMHLLQILDGVLEELIEHGFITEVVSGTVYFSQGG